MLIDWLVDKLSHICMQQQLRSFESAKHVRGFIGLAGPYEIADHYIFESKRVVGPLNGRTSVSMLVYLFRSHSLELQVYTKSQP